MKKLLLSAVALLTVVTSAQAVEKTVTFDFSKPSNYGFETPASTGDKTFTPLAVGAQIAQGGVTITNVNTQESETAVRFWNSNGTITFRLATGGNIDIEAGGAAIYKISFVGYNNTPGTNFTTSDDANWKYDADTKTASWEGNVTKMNITRSKNTVQFATMTVTFEGEAEAESLTETYCPFDENGNVKSEFTEAVAADGKSVINMGTKSIDVIGVGGTTPKDVYSAVADGGQFPGWAEWNDVTWSAKSQNLQDTKPAYTGYTPDYFYYILGTGNPVVEINNEAVNPDATDTIRYRALYTYYGPQDTVMNNKTYKHVMPVMGLYYKFTPKANGALKIQVWSNKGNRNTYLVNETTTLPVAYKAEGYINGQNESIEVTLKSTTGADSTATLNSKKYLKAEEIQALHDAAKVTNDTVWTDDAHTAYSEIIPNDKAPYVIGAGNQHFWGYITLDVEANQTYWLFQDSSQIGFGGYEFTPSEALAIRTVRNDSRNSDQVYDLFGRKASTFTTGRILIQNGRKVIIR